MLKALMLAAVVVVPQVAAAADMPRYREHRHVVRRTERVVERSHYISCSTSNFVLFRVSNCGEFDPLSISGL